MIHSHSYNLNNRDLVISLQSTVCLACGDHKTVRNTFCGGCWKELPVNLRRDLYKPITAGYRQVVIDCLGYLNVGKPVLPGDDRVQINQKHGFKREAITPDIARRAMLGRICPACGRTKPVNQLWCHIDKDRLRDKVDFVIGIPSGGLLFTERLETIEQVYSPDRLRLVPADFAESFFLGLHQLNVTRVQLMRETPSRDKPVILYHIPRTPR